MATRETEFDEQDFGALIKQDISAALTFDQTELSAKRSRALEYYRGEMNDTPSRPNGSSATSRDLADTMAWMLPGIMKVFMASDRMADYDPVAPDVEDPNALKQAEEQAEQASDFASYVFMKDNQGYRIVYNATFDSLLTGNGIVKHWADKTPKRETSFHSYLTVEDIAALMDRYDGDDVKILAKEKNPEPDLVPDEASGQMVPVETYNVKIERTTTRCQFRVEAIEPENFLIDKAAVTIDDAVFVAHRDPYMTRSRLIEMGFDREQVDALSADNSPVLNSEEGASRRTADPFLTNGNLKSTERLDYYECYRKIDVDGDGIAEWVKAHYVGSGGAGEVLDWEVWEDDIPFSDIPCFPVPHDFTALSVADRTMDIQQIKTVLLREALNNTYATGLPMQEVEEGTVTNPDILVSPKFGGIIWRKKDSMARAPIVPHIIPFVADKVLAISDTQDRTLARRTGVSPMSMGLDPETLQNQSATANQNAHDASLSQEELVARNMAELGWTRVFTALLKLFVKHQDRPRMLLLRKKLVKFDPRHWNATMGVTVNTGLGTGSRHRDMQALQMVATNQIAAMERLATAGERSEAIDMIPRVINTFKKSAESAGLRNPDQFYPDFDEEKLKAMKQRAEQAAQKPPLEIQIEQARLQAQGQLKQMELQATTQSTMQTETIKAEGNKVKEAAQLEGDLRKAEADRELQREQIASDERMKAAEIQSRERIEMMKMQMAQQPDPMKERELALKERSVGLEGDLKVAQHNSAMIEAQGKPGSKVKQHPVMDAATKAGEKTAQLEKMIAELAQQASAPVEIVRDQNGVAGARKGGRFYPVKRDASGRVTGVGSPTVQ